MLARNRSREALGWRNFVCAEIAELDAKEMPLKPAVGLSAHVIDDSTLLVNVQHLLTNEFPWPCQPLYYFCAVSIGGTTVGKGCFEHVKMAIAIPLRGPKKAELFRVGVREDAEGIVQIHPCPFDGCFDMQSGHIPRCTVQEEDGKLLLPAVHNLAKKQ